MNAFSKSDAPRLRQPRTWIVLVALVAGLLTLGVALQRSLAATEPELSVRNVRVTEGDDEDVVAKVRVVLSEASDRTVYVDYETDEGTAKSPSDFEDKSGTLRFQPGKTVRSIQVTIVGDTRDERTEYFRVVLEDPVNATIADGSGDVTILDNDGDDDSDGDDGDDGEEPTVSIGNVSVDEGETAVFTVKLSETTDEAVTMDYETRDGSADAGDDYESEDGTLTIKAGKRSTTVSVETYDDNHEEGNETFYVELDDVEDATFADDTGKATIVDDDSTD